MIQVHIFPEGRVNQDPKMIRFKWGVARLLMESKTPPVVLPFWHEGLDRIMPEESKIKLPRLGRDIKIVFGKPIDLTEDIDRVREMDDKAAARIALTNKVYAMVDELSTPK
ncbi:hypothetical protein HK102_003608 [Quaeritorhiza haematococci]|nr:hypothetical protein HK102_003608 [Quaeritorhiza haematococci]